MSKKKKKDKGKEFKEAFEEITGHAAPSQGQGHVVFGKSLQDVVEMFVAHFGEQVKKKMEKESGDAADEDVIDMSHYLKGFDNPHNQEGLAKKRTDCIAEVMAWSDTQVVQVLSNLAKSASCGCGNPEHWIHSCALLFLLPHIEKRMREGRKVAKAGR